MVIVDKTREKFFPSTVPTPYEPPLCGTCGRPQSLGSHRVPQKDGTRVCRAPVSPLRPRDYRSGVQREQARLTETYPRVWGVVR